MSATESKTKNGRGCLDIVVAIDESQSSTHALQWAATHMFQTAKKVTLLHAYPYSPIHGLPGTEYISGDYIKNLNETLRKISLKKAQDLLKDAAQICKNLGNPPHAWKILVSSSPSGVKHDILKYIDKEEPDILIVGSRGMGSMDRAFLGSVSDFLTQNATCSVMVVKQPLLSSAKPMKIQEAKSD
mmetsp:Transcript_19126/g.28609  ORF Transcript_19126/g.28609 Transcript_19126/m.28609 type:complete len:186 (+) Transcript_19126:52-609(+)